MDSILRCAMCKKPFDKESTLKRHGYYCRTKKAGLVSKKRSCGACVKSKARCDGVSPCSRCKSRHISCHYPAKASGAEVHKRSGADDAAYVENEAEGLDLHARWMHAAPKSVETDLIDSSAIGSLAGSAWTGSALAVDAPEEAKLQMGDELLTSLPWMQNKVSIPQMLPFNVRSLFQRPSKDGERKTAAMLFNNLGSFPLMILRQHSLPPYIHPNLITEGSTNDDKEFICNCISLMHMMGKGMRGSKKLFWRNVRQECERMCEDHLSLNRWELLAAIQALSVYLLVRLYEGETDDNNIDALLITAVTLISVRINQNDAMQTPKRGRDLETRWKDWIYAESMRRICVIYQVVNMLVYFEPAMLCDLESDIILAPLPSKRRLWEASDEFAWSIEEKGDTAFGMAANGQLVKLGENLRTGSEMHHSQRQDRTADWTEWCSEMDALGGIVMLAASLQG